jgi:hypothetical protein
VSVEDVGFEHHARPDELWEALLRGSVRTAALIHSQTAEQRHRLRAAFDRLAAEHADAGGGCALPVVFLLASVRRPAG